MAIAYGTLTSQSKCLYTRDTSVREEGRMGPGQRSLQVGAGALW